MPEPVSTTITAAWSCWKAGWEIGEFINKNFSQDENYYRVFVFNGISDNIYVALHFYVSECWVTRKWFKVQAGETALVLGSETKLKNRIIYSYAHNSDYWKTWTGDDFKEIIDGKERWFAKDVMDEKRKNCILRFTSE